MTIRAATEEDRVKWDDCASLAGGSFLHSWSWGEFQAALGVAMWRFVAEESGVIVASMLVLQRQLPMRFSWLYVPGGVATARLLNGQASQLTKEVTRVLQEVGKKTGAVFARMDVGTSEVKNSLQAQGWAKSDHDVQPRNTAVLNLLPSEDELLVAMHQKTRYNIRMAAKKGVTVRFSSDPKDVEIFLRLTKEVSRRTRFSYHPDSYYMALLNTLGRQGAAELAIAEYEGKPVAAHLMIYSGKRAAYVHGASSQEFKSVMAPHLLYWETIRRAKEKGCTAYDFYGVAPVDAPTHHPWTGITRIKMGFAGTYVSYEGSYDLALRPVEYTLYQLVRQQIRGVRKLR